MIAAALYGTQAGANESDVMAVVEVKPVEITVSSTDDSGPGTLRAAITEANESGKPYRIDFGTSEGLFSTPQEIRLKSPLPVIDSDIEIDGHIAGLLWRSYGTTIHGNDQFRLFEVGPGGALHIKGITLINGHSDFGGAVLNKGSLVVEGVTFEKNLAEIFGGAIANQGGQVYLVNSTAFDNYAESGWCGGESRWSLPTGSRHPSPECCRNR